MNGNITIVGARASTSNRGFMQIVPLSRGTAFLTALEEGLKVALHGGATRQELERTSDFQAALEETGTRKVCWPPHARAAARV